MQFSSACCRVTAMDPDYQNTWYGEKGERWMAVGCAHRPELSRLVGLLLVEETVVLDP